MQENWCPKKHFPVKNKSVSVTKRLLFTSKLVFYSFLEVFHATKWSKNLIFLLFLALVLASGATRPHLEVSEHPLNPQFQGLKIDLCGYCRANYISRSAPRFVRNLQTNCWSMFDHFVGLVLKGLNTGTTDETFQQSGKQDSFRLIQLVCKKVQAHSSLEPPLRYNQDQMPLKYQGSL